MLLNHKMRAAAKLYRDFTGHRAVPIGTIKLPHFKTGLAIGRVTALTYITIREGVHLHYQHTFSESGRPLLVVSSDGKAALLIGGSWRFTKRGFVDPR